METGTSVNKIVDLGILRDGKTNTIQVKIAKLRDLETAAAVLVTAIDPTRAADESVGHGSQP